MQTSASDLPGTTIEVYGAGGGAYSSEFTFRFGPFGLLPVRLEVDDDGTFLTTDLITDSYGVGADIAAALADLTSAVRSHFAFLREEGEGRLSQRFSNQLRILENALAATSRANGRLATTTTAGVGSRMLRYAA